MGSMRGLVLDVIGGFNATVINILLLGDSKMQCCMCNFCMFKFYFCFLYYHDVLFNDLVKINFFKGRSFILNKFLIPYLLIV